MTEMFDDKENVSDQVQADEVTQTEEPVSEAGEEETSGSRTEETSEEASEPADEEEQGEEKTGQETDGEPSGKEEDDKKPFFKKKKDKKDQQIEELQDRVQRQMAEFDNFRKRTQKEKDAMFEMGEKEVIEKMLPIVDSMERGLAGTDENSEDAFVVGMNKIYKQLLQTLESLDVKAIEAVGKEFDPDYHNAVMHVEDDSVGENIVVEELQKGYMLHDKVVRHSMVKVAN